jgi:opacity protein-like surface antigen
MRGSWWSICGRGRGNAAWTGKVEYRYIDLGTVNGTVINTPSSLEATYSSRVTDKIFRVGVNYPFK